MKRSRFKIRGVYGLFQNDLCFYVGVSKHVVRRFNNHKTNHGKDIKCVILEKTPTLRSYLNRDDFKVERKWIKHYELLGHPLKNKQGTNAYKLTRS